MPQGLRIFDSSGVVKFDTNRRPSRIVSYFDSGTAAGFVDLVNDPAIQYFTVVIPALTSNLCPPTTTISGYRVSWDWLAPPGTWRASAIIIIGAI